MVTTLVDLLERHACDKPASLSYAFLHEDGSSERRSFAELYGRVRAVASRLHGLAEKGDRVLLMYQPGLDFIEAMLACFAVGALAVPVQPAQNRRVSGKMAAVMRDSGSRLVLTNAATAKAAQDLLPGLDLPECAWLETDAIEAAEGEGFRRPEVAGEDVAFLQYTSGSTGAPKGVMVTHANILDNEAMIKRAFGHDDSTVFVGWLPLYHDMGLIGNVLQPLFLGIPSVLFAPMAFLVSPVSWLRAVSQWGATTSGAPSFAYEHCVQRVSAADLEGIDLSSWRVAYNGAEPVKAHVIEAFARKFEPYGFRREAFYPCYGMAEATLFISGGDPAKPVSTLPVDPEQIARNRAVEAQDSPMLLVGCGHAHGDHRVRIVDPETLAVLPDGGIGEIWLQGPSVAAGYWGKPDLTEQTFCARTADGDGPCLRTGDLGFQRGGELYVTGRLKDLIIVRGENHYPADIESTVYRNQDVLRSGSVAAFAIETEAETRLVVVAEVERRALAKLEEPLVQSIVARARKDVSEAHGLRLHELVLIRPSTLAKTSSGKIRRSHCRELYLSNRLDLADQGREPRRSLHAH
jgi:acyl-CoA synthetase (AMP-forming)/AMP-acid ligase II